MTPELLADLPTSALEELSNTVHTILHERYLTSLKTVVTDVLAERMPEQDITAVTFGTDGWENGYFYTPASVEVVTTDGRTHEIDIDGNDALDALLLNVSYDVTDSSTLTLTWT